MLSTVKHGRVATSRGCAPPSPPITMPASGSFPSTFDARQTPHPRSRSGAHGGPSTPRAAGRARRYPGRGLPPHSETRLASITGTGERSSAVGGVAGGVVTPMSVAGADAGGGSARCVAFSRGV
jgi:hypothetical protein